MEKKSQTITVSIVNTDIFDVLLNGLVDIFKDESLDHEILQKHYEKIINKLNSYKKDIDFGEINKLYDK